MRRTAAGVLAGALALSGAVATALPANAAAGFDLVRVAGDDRYETSALTVAAFGTAPGAIIASGENGRSADALAASFLAGVRGVPVALTTKTRVTAEVLASLNALGGKNVTIVGGPEAVGPEVVAQLQAAGFTVDRVFGANRYETAAAVTAAGESAPDESNIGLIASGTSTIDALAGGPLAYAGKHPVLLVTRDGVPGATLRAIQAAGITSVYVLGGEAVVGARAVEQLRAAGVTVRERLAGDNRSETSVAIANELIENFGFSATTFNLASGLNEGVDALSAAALSGKERRVLLLTQNANTAPAVTGFATANTARLTSPGRVFGGEAAITPTFVTAVETAGGASAGFQTLNVTPNDAVTLQLADDEGANATQSTADNRTYTVTGLNDALQYRITLVNAASIQGTGTSRTFLSSAISPATTPATFGVNIGTDIADIVSVGGTTPTIEGTAGGTANTATVTPVNGSITFTIDGDTTGTVVPVVYVNGGQGGTATTGGTNNRLETSATAEGAFAAATESFGLGGATTFINPAAQSQSFTTQRAVDSVSKGTNQLDAGGFTFTYDANDTFFVADAGTPGTFVPVTLEAFEERLSREDTFAASYSATGSVSSSFSLVDVGPAAPNAVDPTTPGDSDDIRVALPINANVDSVVIQRATVTGGTDEGTNGTVGTFATVATVTPTAAQRAAGEVVFDDMNLAPGTYRYRAAYVGDGQQSAFSPTGANEVALAPAADTAGPRAIDTVSSATAGLAGDLGTGDAFQIVFNEAIGTPSATATLRLTDANGTVGDVVNGSNATFGTNAAAVTVNGVSRPAGTVLTVSLTGAPAIVVAGGVVGVQLPASITDAGGVADARGNAFDEAADDQDVEVQAMGGDTLTDASDATAPTATVSNPGANGTSATVQFSEAVTGLAVGDFVIVNAADADTDATTNPTVTVVTAVDADTYTITIGGGEALAVGDTVRLTLNTVSDAGNANAGPTANTDRVVS